MPYVTVRIYSLSGARTGEELAEIALTELAPKLAEGSGLARYTVTTLSDGRVASFSVYESQDAAKRGQQIAAEMVSKHTAFQGIKLAEILEGEAIYTAQGAVPMTGRLHGLVRIYTTDASVSDVKAAFESEGPAVLRSFSGLSRYTVVKLTDGRIAVFNSFDTLENARRSSDEAKKARGKSGSQIARTLPSDPLVLQGVVIGTYAS